MLLRVPTPSTLTFGTIRDQVAQRTVELAYIPTLDMAVSVVLLVRAETFHVRSGGELVGK